MYKITKETDKYETMSRYLWVFSMSRDPKEDFWVIVEYEKLQLVVKKRRVFGIKQTVLIDEMFRVRADSNKVIRFC